MMSVECKNAPDGLKYVEGGRVNEGPRKGTKHEGEKRFI